MPSILIQLDEPLLKSLNSLNKVAPAAKRQRAEFIRRAVKEAIRKREYEIWWADLPKPCVVNCDNLRTISPIPARRIREVKRGRGLCPSLGRADRNDRLRQV